MSLVTESELQKSIDRAKTNVPSTLEPDKTAIERLFVALDKAGSTSRLGILKGMNDGGDTSFEDVLKRDKEVGGRDVISAIGRKTGLDLEFGGEKEGYSTADKVGNFITDLGVNVLTDPLTYVGVGLFSKATKAAKALGFTGNTAKAVGRASIGAGMGLAASNEKDTVGGVLGNIAVGAVTLGAGGPALRKFGKEANKVGGKLVDKFQASMSPEIMGHPAVKELKMSYSKAWGLAKSAADRFKFVSREAQRLDRKLLANMDTKQMEVVQGFMDTKNLLFHNERNKLKLKHLADGAIKKSGATKVTAALEKLEANAAKKNIVGNELATAKKELYRKLGGKDYTDKQLAEATGIINNRVFKEAEVELTALADPQLTTNVGNYIKRNREIIKQNNAYNKSMFPRADAEFQELVPIDFHTFEILDKDQLVNVLGKDTFKNIRAGFIERASNEPIRTGGLSMAERLRLEADNLATRYMSKHERTARKLISLVENVPPADATDASIKKFFSSYDDMTTFIKKQHLFFSHNWVVNNFTENTIRAYISGGPKLAWRTLMNQGKAAIRKIDDDLVRDLSIITNPNLVNKGLEFSDDMMNVALDYGAIEKGFFNEMFSGQDITKKYLVAKRGTQGAEQALEQASNKGLVGKFQDFTESTVGRTGAMIEGASRFTSFKHHVNKLIASDEALAALNITTDPKILKQAIKSPEMRKQIITIPKVGNDLDKIFRNASDITGEIFFNYQNVSAFEQKVMKRIFPYWTFFSRNAPFWLDKIAERPDAISQVFNVVKSTGKKLTPSERENMPDFKLKRLPRHVSDRKFMSIPNLSFFDVSNLLGGEPQQEAFSKVHPALKLAGQVLKSEDAFGGKLYPSDTSKGEKRVYYSGTKFAPFLDSIKRNTSKDLVTKSNATQIAIALQQALLPVGAIDTAANIVGDVKSGKRTFGEAMFNLGPMKINNLQRSKMKATRKYRRQERNFEKRRKSFLDADDL